MSIQESTGLDFSNVSDFHSHNTLVADIKVTARLPLSFLVDQLNHTKQKKNEKMFPLKSGENTLHYSLQFVFVILFGSILNNFICGFCGLPLFYFDPLVRL